MENMLMSLLLQKKMTEKSLTMEEYQVLIRTDPKMLVISSFAFTLELIYQILTLFFLPAYVFLSNFGRRFHIMLRIQLCLLLFEIFGATITRGTVVFLRFIDAYHKLPPNWITFINLVTQVNMSVVSSLNLTVWIIAIERLVAAIRLRSYEKGCSNPIEIGGVLFFLVVPPGCVDWVLYWSGNFSIYEDNWLWNIMTFVVCFLYGIGFAAMEWCRVISKRHLMADSRKLSSSFQCKENILVVNMIRPMFIMFVIVRCVNFVISYYLFSIELEYGPIPLRIISLLYDQCNGITFLSVPLILLKQHPGLTKYSRREEVNTRADGDQYFNRLMNQWK